MSRKRSTPTPTARPKALPPNLLPQGKMPPLMTFHRHPWLWLFRHWLFKHFRTRLVCPNCGAVGTWKPHGYWWKDRDVKRWLCKWCGFYDGTDGRYWCAINPKIGAWDKRGPGMFTPEEFAREKGFNPWIG